MTIFLPVNFKTLRRFLWFYFSDACKTLLVSLGTRLGIVIGLKMSFDYVLKVMS